MTSWGKEWQMGQVADRTQKAQEGEEREGRLLGE